MRNDLVTLHELSLSDVLHVCKFMRPSDWIEVVNLVPSRFATPEHIAMLTMQHSGVGFVLRAADVPTVVVQAVEKHDGCWSIGMFATEDFPLCWRALIYEARDFLVPIFKQLGARYLEAHVLADNEPARRLLEFIGFRRVSDLLAGYGTFGKDFLLYAITEREANVLFQSKNQRSGTAG